MSRVRAFGAFWYDFVVGDDWRIAAGAVLGLAVTAALVHLAHVAAWWALPVAVVLGLALSLRMATRPAAAAETTVSEAR
jgi:hypothetical protein